MLNRLLERLKAWKILLYCTDDYRPYDSALPAVEQNNSRQRYCRLGSCPHQNPPNRKTEEISPALQSVIWLNWVLLDEPAEHKLWRRSCDRPARVARCAVGKVWRRDRRSVSSPDLLPIAWCPARGQVFFQLSTVGSSDPSHPNGGSAPACETRRGVVRGRIFVSGFVNCTRLTYQCSSITASSCARCGVARFFPNRVPVPLPMANIDPLMKRVLIYGMNYAPEFAGVGRYTGEIAEYLAALGADVTVVTTPAHYPGWYVKMPYRNGRYSSEIRNNVRVYRCPLMLREKMGGVWRLLAPLSFALTSAPIALWQMLRRRPNIMLTVEPTLIAAPAGLLGARLVGARTVLHVQDLEPDTAFAVGHLPNWRWLRWLGGVFELVVLGSFDQIITISDQMAGRLAEKGVPAARIAVVRNWVDLDHISPLDGPSPYRIELGYSANDFIVLYSGNAGAKQGLGVLLDAAKRLSDQRHIQFVVAGEGPAKAELIARYGTLPTVRFLPFQPYERFSAFLGLANLHVLPQHADAADLDLPSKLGGMLASGRRILVMAAPATELANFLADVAILVTPGNALALAKAILAAAAESRADEREAERRRILATCLSKSRGLTSFAAVLDQRRRSGCAR
jgi:colanic acid biosynthesis glycosyl transferase WcaI